jgi:putative transposase
MFYRTVEYYWRYREQFKMSLNMLYLSIGISKQAFHKRLDRQRMIVSEQKQLLKLIYQIREDHPTMNCRDMYFMLQPECMGRDAFERFCREEGLMVERIKNWKRTTDSTGVVRFSDLTIDIIPTKMNEIWSSDITYYQVEDRFYYITFIIDNYSRRIVGHQTSNRLTTEQTTLPALQKAINLRNSSLVGLIFHSDGGGQYYDKEFLNLTKEKGIKNSMCEYPWENGKAERINGVIKNNYLIHRNIKNFNELVKEVDRSVELYNHVKPHIKLKRVSPIKFESSYICNGQKSESEKSVSEINITSKGNNLALSGYGQKSSSSNIAMEINKNKNLKRST